MANFADAARYIRTMRLLAQIKHSHHSARYQLELSKKDQPSPVALPQWLFGEMPKR